MCVWKACILIASVACGIVVMHSHWMSALFVQLCLHSDWLSVLVKKEASMFEMVSNSIVISEINL